MSKRIIAPSLLAALWMCLPASAQDVDVLERLFGAGVHAYYSGDFVTANEDLSSVIARGTKDPRPYYFRALALMRLGRPDEAQSDLAAGSDLETQDIDGSYPVGRSLERVQGSSRAQVEKYRTKARLESLHRKRDQDKQRYEAIQKREAEVLRRQVNVPLGDAPAGGAKTPPAAKGGEAADPFDEPKAKPAAKPPAVEPAAEEPAMEEPAAEATEEPAAEEPAADDPFAEPAAKAKGGAKKPAAEPADDAAPAEEAPADDPFAEPAAKPKAAPKAAGKAAPKKAPAAASDDPFGGDAAMEEDTPPADDAGGAKSDDAAGGDDAAASDDPFGGAEPAKKAPAAKAPAAKKPVAKPPAVKPSADESSEDPFGGAATDTAEEMPADDKAADDKAADDGGDPFGDDGKGADNDKADDEKPAKDDAKPAAEKDDSDPFGN